MADPLSDVLSLLEARSALSTGLAASGKWAIRVGGYEGLKFNAVVKGTALLLFDEAEAPVRLAQGDCFMLSGGAPFVLASDLAVPSRDAADVFANAREGLARIGAGEETVIIGGKLVMSLASAGFLTDALPTLVYLPAHTTGAVTVRWLLEKFTMEASSNAPGSRALASQSMFMIFIELMRMPAVSEAAAPTGWIAAMSDPRIGRALSAMHAEPYRGWTLPELANLAHLSRSGFALRFKKTVGVSPLDYLLRWRMHLAARALRQEHTTVASVAEASGYASESAFGSAFKRVFGCSPRTYVPKRYVKKEATPSG